MTLVAVDVEEQQNNRNYYNSTFIIASAAETPASDVVEEEPEEEEEPEDQKERIESECMETKECAPVKARFDSCAERVTGNPDSGEDCVEEFFDLMHCVHECAPEKIFHHLK